jgi:hypothetical protein
MILHKKMKEDLKKKVDTNIKKEPVVESPKRPVRDIINLFSPDLDKKIQQRGLIKIPTWLAGIFGLLFVVFLISLGSFIVSLYYSNQISEKGKTLIQLRSDQNKYSNLIDQLSMYNSRKTAIANVNKQIIKFDSVINELDRLTKNTLTSYSLDKISGYAEVKGTVVNSVDISGITDSIRNSSYFDNVLLTKLNRINPLSDSAYEYTISFKLNNEKIQTL